MADLEIENLTRKYEPEFQCVESYLFIRRGEELTERVLITTPRLSQNRDSLGGMRPIAILYSKITNNEELPTAHWVKATTPYLTTDGKEAVLTTIKTEIYPILDDNKKADLDKTYMQDTQASLEILREALPEFKSKYSLYRINLENIVHTFEREVTKRATR